MITPEQAERLAREWIEAFNRHDLEAVCAHYADDVEFMSPAIVEVLGEPSGTIRGKEAVRVYFERALERYPNLGFDLLDVLTGVDSVSILFRSAHRSEVGNEVMLLDARGLVTKVLVHYGTTTEG